MNAEHERCSELLAGYLRGELTADQARTVDEHLASCPECRAEQRALEALLAPVDPLTDIERARLHSETWGRIADDAGPHRKPLMARIAPALASAAVLILIAVGVVSTMGGGDDEDSGAGGGDAAEESEDLQGGDAFGDEGAGNDTLEGDAEAALTVAAPYFDPKAGDLTPTKISRTAANFNYYRDSYDAAQAKDLAGDFLQSLADQAGKSARAVAECGQLVIDNRGGTALAGYGGLGLFERREALVLGFATSSNAQRLDRYSFWIFDRDDCSQPLRIEEGFLGD